MAESLTLYIDYNVSKVFGVAAVCLDSKCVYNSIPSPAASSATYSEGSVCVCVCAWMGSDELVLCTARTMTDLDALLTLIFSCFAPVDNVYVISS